LHHGRIEAHSAGIGCGAEFVARLPIVSAAVPVSAPETAVAKPPLEAPPGKPGHILVVDDNRHAAQTLAMLLQRWDYEVRIAFDPFTALEEARTHAPWVVLLDIGMPGMDGYEVARRLRSQPESRAAHLVALTGYGEDEDRRRAESAGFDYHLLKPAAPDDLHKLLRKLAAAVGTPERPAP
jgi:two-component system CheB/CheR fusion protein